MAQVQTQSISTEKFLIMAANLLHRMLLDVPRTQAKNAYKEIAKGVAIPLATVKMEDQSTTRFSLMLDHSEFNGKVNFSVFRNSLELLISNLGQTLESKKEIAVFSAEHDASLMMFGVTAVTQEGSDTNVMVLGSDMNEGRSSVMLRLMYIDSSQFSQSQV